VKEDRSEGLLKTAKCATSHHEGVGGVLLFTGLKRAAAVSLRARIAGRTRLGSCETGDLEGGGDRREERRLWPGGQRPRAGSSLRKRHGGKTHAHVSRGEFTWQESLCQGVLRREASMAVGIASESDGTATSWKPERAQSRKSKSPAVGKAARNIFARKGASF